MHYQKTLPLGTKFTISQETAQGFNITFNAYKTTYIDQIPYVEKQPQTEKVPYTGSIGIGSFFSQSEVFNSTVVQNTTDTIKSSVDTVNVRLFPHVENNASIMDLQSNQSTFYVHKFLDATANPYNDRMQGACNGRSWAVSSYQGDAKGFGQDKGVTNIAKIGYVCDMAFTRFVFPIDKVLDDSDCPNSTYSVMWSGTYWTSDRCKGTGAHPGMDIAIPSGTNIRAIAGGVVVKSYDNDTAKGWGGLVVIKHSLPNETVWSVYAHLKERKVAEGNDVTVGQPIGLSGGGGNDPHHGNSTGAHLHFQIERKFNGISPYYPSGTETADNIEELKAATYDPIKFIKDHK